MGKIYNIEDRQIRVFISSTFTDMQAERENLAKYVFPKVKEYARKHGVDFDFVDLRWGITEEEAHQGKVIECCLKSIDNCRPLFIGMLGGNYGWIPENQELEKNPDITLYFPWITPLIGDRSMTEIEIVYGAFMQESNSLFFIRKDVNGASLKQSDLVGKIRTHFGENVHNYDDVEVLSQLTEQFICNYIDKIFPNDDWSDEKQYDEENNYVVRHLEARYLSRPLYEEQIKAFVTSDDEHYLFIAGDEGVGKKSLALCAIRQAEAEGIPCLYDMTGNAQKINIWLKPRYEALAASGNRGVVVVGNADSILSANNNDSANIPGYEWLLFAPSNIKVVLCLSQCDKVSAYKNSEFANTELIIRRPIPDDELYAAIVRRLYSDNPQRKSHIKILNIELLNDEECRSIIDRILKRCSKTLTTRLVDKIVDNKCYHYPKLLNYLVEELVRYGSFEKLESFVDTFLPVKNNSDYFNIVVPVYDSILGQSLCSRICSFLWHFYFAIDEDAIKTMLGLSHYDWARFVNTFSIYLDINNDGVKLKESFVSDMSEEKAYGMFLEYCETNPISDYSKLNIINICIKSDDQERWLSKYLTVPSVYKYSDTLRSVTEGWILLKSLKESQNIFEELNFKEAVLHNDYELYDYDIFRNIVKMLCQSFPEEAELIWNIIIEGAMVFDVNETAELLFEATHSYMPSEWMVEIFNKFNKISDTSVFGEPTENTVHIEEYIKIINDLRDEEDEDLEAALEKFSSLLSRMAETGYCNHRLIGDILYARGCLLSGLGRNEEALAETEKALYFAENPTEIHLLLATLKIRMGRVYEAIDEMEFADNLEICTYGTSRMMKTYRSKANLYDIIEEYDAARFYRSMERNLAVKIFGEDSAFVEEIDAKLYGEEDGVDVTFRLHGHTTRRERQDEAVHKVLSDRLRREPTPKENLFAELKLFNMCAMSRSQIAAKQNEIIDSFTGNGNKMAVN